MALDQYFQRFLVGLDLRGPMALAILAGPMAVMIGLAAALGIWRRECPPFVKTAAVIWSIVLTFMSLLMALYIGCYVYADCP